MKKAKIKQSGLHFLFPTFITSLPHHKHIFKTAGKYTLYVCVFSFLLFNAILSQVVPPAYFQMMNDNQDSVAYYLQSIRSLPQFPSELSRLESVYGKGLEGNVFSKEIGEKKLIQKYEQILDKNPYAKEVLYSLYLLYGQKGGTKLAQEYFERAKAVDPTLK